MKNIYIDIYNILLTYYNKQNWWPGQTIDEIVIGAILTQNTSWNNVEKSIINLKKNKLLSLKSIYKCNTEELKINIKPSGFFNQKSIYLKNIASFYKEYNFNHNDIKKMNIEELRKKLLSIKGIGKETADSIILYAYNKPIFVIDAYTKRIFSRHIRDFPKTYSEIQDLFHKNLGNDSMLFNEYHALIVKCGKNFCKRANPQCEDCPLNILFN